MGNGQFSFSTRYPLCHLRVSQSSAITMEKKLSTPPLNFIMPLAWFAASNLIRSTPIKRSKVAHQSEKVLSCLPAALFPTPDHFVASPAL